MQTKILGTPPHSLNTPPQGLGCMGLSAFYTTSTELHPTEKLHFLQQALALGITFLDTADVYGPHTNEQLIGEAIRGLDRSKLILASKFGAILSEEGLVVRGDREYVRQCVEGSLARLGVDYIDLYYVHRIDQSVPIEETIEELSKFVAAGKIRHIGLSEAHPDTVRRAHRVHPITAYQLEWSLWSRGVEEDLIPVLRELGIGIVAYSPLGQGFFAGAFQDPAAVKEGDLRASDGRFSQDNLKMNLPLLENLRRVASEKGATAAQIALAWVQNQGEDVVAIPGTTKMRNLEENWAATKIVLAPEELRRIAEVVPAAGVAGDEGGCVYREERNPAREEQ